MMAREPLIAVGIALLLVGCGKRDAGQSGGEDKKAAPVREAGAKEVGVSDAARKSDNPAEWDDVKVHRPKRLENVVYDSSTRTLTDLDTGDRLVITFPSGPGDSPHQFGFSNEKTGGIAGGSFLDKGDSKTQIYQVTSILITEDGFRTYRAREEYDIARIAELFRAFTDQVNPNHKYEILVVDTRPEKKSEINPQNGIRKDAE
jgi:hypothetical protein